MARNNRILVDAFLNRSCATDVPFDSMLLNGMAPTPFQQPARRLFDDCYSVMPRIGGRRAPIRCRKPLKTRMDLS